MVVRCGDKVNAAVDYDVGVLSRRDEREVDLRVVVGKVFVGEDALEVCNGEIVILKILDGVRERIGVVPVYDPGVPRGMLGVVRVRPKRAVADDGERVGLGRRGRCRSRFRCRRRGWRGRCVERRDYRCGAITGAALCTGISGESSRSFMVMTSMPHSSRKQISLSIFFILKPRKEAYIYGRAQGNYVPKAGFL